MAPSLSETGLMWPVIAGISAAPNAAVGIHELGLRILTKPGSRSISHRFGHMQRVGMCMRELSECVEDFSGGSPAVVEVPGDICPRPMVVIRASSLHEGVLNRALAGDARGPCRTTAGAATAAHPRIGGLGRLLEPGDPGTGRPPSRHPDRPAGLRTVPTRAVLRRDRGRSPAEDGPGSMAWPPRSAGAASGCGPASGPSSASLPNAPRDWCGSTMPPPCWRPVAPSPESPSKPAMSISPTSTGRSRRSPG